MNCIVCNAEFNRKKIGKFCSKKCQYIGSSGTNNHFYKGANLKSNCMVCNKEFTYFKSNTSGKYCSSKCSFMCPEWRKKQSQSKLGKRMSLECREKMSISGKGKKKSKTWLANNLESRKKYYDKKGRITPELNLIRASDEYNQWRKHILQRDGYKCVKCNSNKKLEIDHIIPLGVIYREKKLNNNIDLFDTSNGRTLCKVCHTRTYSYAKHTSKTLEGKLMDIIWEIYKEHNEQTKPGVDFDQFYNEKMDGLIEHFKGKLD